MHKASITLPYLDSLHFAPARYENVLGVGPARVQDIGAILIVTLPIIASNGEVRGEEW